MLRILEHVGCQRTREDIRSDQQSGPSTSGRGGRQKPAMRMERQTVLVSATMPRTVLQAAVKWVRGFCVQCRGWLKIRGEAEEYN